MKPSLWDNNNSANWEINQQQQKTQEGSDMQGRFLKSFSEIHQLQQWAETYITTYLLVKSAAVTQSRLQCNYFNPELRTIHLK